MFKKIFFIILFTLPIIGQVQPLGHQMGDVEQELYKNYTPPLPLFRTPTPPPYPVRAMAEWEELEGIMISWTSYQSILSQIVDYAQEEGKVWIVCSDSNSVINYLNNQSVPLTNIKFLLTSFNSIWIRDYGPWTVYANNSDSLYIIDWIYNRPRPYDDQIPVAFANYAGLPIYEAISYPNNLTHTGGNFMVDGHGKAFASKLILTENPTKTEAEIDTIMSKFLGINQFIKMTTLPYDGIHHIDMHMKLLDEETLLVGQYPLGVADGPQIETNLRYVLENFMTCYGRPFKVVRIPMPPDAYGHYPNSNGDYRTYTNSIIINKTVIIPTYELKYDTTAFRIYREAMPGYNIVGMNSSSIIPLLGAIHCITKEVGAANPILISHKGMGTVSDTLTSYKIEAQIKHNHLLDSALVLWSIDTTLGFNSVSMTATRGDSFEAEIPQQIPGSEIYYYISAYSELGKSISKPRTAPVWSYQFKVKLPTAITEKEINPKKFVLYQNYPNPFNPKTVIKYQLPENGHVELNIYNILGEKIAELGSKKQTAGLFEVEWNAINFASGVYFYKLIFHAAADGTGKDGTSKRIVKTRKLILLK